MIRKIFLLIILSTVFFSCNSENGIMSELNENRQLWESKQIKNYKWNERRSCECAGPLQRNIFVVNLVKDRVEFDESEIPSGVNEEEFRNYIFNSSRTVKESFDFIEELLSKDVLSLSIEYDQTYGFPTIISVDYDADIVDDEILYVYTNFEEPLEINLPN